MLDHKQKILQRKFREGQQEYFGKRGMSLLGCMVVQWITNGESTGFKHTYIDIIFKGYSGQDNVQVSSALQLLVEKVHEMLPSVATIVLQSDNASCFESQNLIPFVYHLNRESESKHLPIIRRWLFTEAQTGKSRLDTHFSYLNVTMSAFVEDGNDIMTEDGLFEALTYRGGVAGTAVVLVNAGKLPKTCIVGKYTNTALGCRATHDIHWDPLTHQVQLYEAANISLPVSVKSSILEKHGKTDVSLLVLQQFMSLKQAPLYATGVSAAKTQTIHAHATSRARRIMSALQTVDIHPPEKVAHVEVPTCASCPLQMGWARHTSNNDAPLNAACVDKLKKLYAIGKQNKKYKISAERAHAILLDTVIPTSWEDQLHCTLAKVKQFFGKDHSHQGEYKFSQTEIDDIIEDMINEEREAHAMTLLDVEQPDQKEAEA